MNKVFLSGNLTRDPEIKRTANGRAYTRIGIAINRRYKNSSTGQYEQSTEFFNLVAWEKTAEFFGRYLRKGSRVLVEGRLQTYNYEGRDGIKRSGVDVLVENVEFADSKRVGDSQRGGNDNYGGGYQSGNDDLGVPVPDDSVPFMDDPPQQPTDDNVPF